MVDPVMAEGLGKARMLQMQLQDILPWEQCNLSRTSTLAIGVHYPKRTIYVSTLQLVFTPSLIEALFTCSKNVIHTTLDTIKKKINKYIKYLF